MNKQNDCQSIVEQSSISRRAFLEGLGILGIGLGLGACSNSGSDSISGPASGNNSGSNSSSSNDAASSSTADASASSPSSGKTLVAYFSAQGHTRRVAEALADDLGADLFEIVPAEPYSDDDLNFNEETSRVVQEYENEDQRDTELAQNAPENFADYDTVFVGYPIWWSDSAWAMHHFASENDFTGKTVYPFCTSMSSGLGQSGTNLAALAGTGDWQDGQRFGENANLDDVQKWADSLQA